MLIDRWKSIGGKIAGSDAYIDQFKTALVGQAAVFILYMHSGFRSSFTLSHIFNSRNQFFWRNRSPHKPCQASVSLFAYVSFLKAMFSIYSCLICYPESNLLSGTIPNTIGALSELSILSLGKKSLQNLFHVLAIVSILALTIPIFPVDSLRTKSLATSTDRFLLR